MTPQPHESKAKQSDQYYAWTSTDADTEAEDGDQGGNWTKGDEISTEDETTKDEGIIIDDQSISTWLRGFPPSTPVSSLIKIDF